MTPTLLTPRERDRRQVRRAANCASLFPLVVLAAIWLFGNSLPSLLISLGIFDPQQNYFGLGEIGYECFSMVLYALSMLSAMIPALILRRPFPFRRRCNQPLKWHNAMPLILTGAGACIAANVIASLVTNFFNLESSSATDPSFVPTIPGLVIALISTALLPALLEEMTFRGYMMQLMRPYGDSTALFYTSVLFALLHGNVTQAVFAFVLGLMFGFMALRTGNIWPSVILHFINNAYATLAQYAGAFFPGEEMQNRFLTVMQVIMLLSGVVGLWFLRTRTNLLRAPANGPWRTLTSRERTGAVLTSPITLISLGVLTAYVMMDKLSALFSFLFNAVTGAS